MFNMCTTCNVAHVKSVLWLLNMLQHVLDNNLQFNFHARQVVNKVTPLHSRLLPKTCCSMFRRSQSTDFTCAMLQAVHILNICKTFHGIHMPLNFLSKFTGINLVYLNINPLTAKYFFSSFLGVCNIQNAITRAVREITQKFFHIWIDIRSVQSYRNSNFLLLLVD